MAGDETSTDFGFERVRLEEKQDRVNEVFRSVAKRYDLMNDLMSGGLHRAWKSAFVSTLRPSRTRPFRLLDVAGGTGDIAFRIVRAGGAGTRVTVADISPEMVAEGSKLACHVDVVGSANGVDSTTKALTLYTFEGGKIAHEATIIEKGNWKLTMTPVSQNH